MKKLVSVTFTIITIILMLATVSCKKSEAEFIWSKLEGSGSYSSTDNTSTIKLSGWIMAQQPEVRVQPLQLFLADWQYLVMEGSTVVINVKKDGVTQIFGDVTMSATEISYDFIWVEIETKTPKDGDIFSGHNPDALQFEVIIQDDSGNFYTMAAATSFQFERN